MGGLLDPVLIKRFYVGDLNTISTNAGIKYLILADKCTNMPTGISSNASFLIDMRFDAVAAFQILFIRNVVEVYTRSSSNSGWTIWNKI